MKEVLITFETAKLAKQKGFDEVKTNHLPYMLEGDDEGCIGASIYCKVYANCCTQSLLQKWLREVHNIHLMVEPYYNEQELLVYGFDLITVKIDEETITEGGFETYEDALEVGLQEGLKLLN